jgi:hypothetical protein
MGVVGHQRPPFFCQCQNGPEGMACKVGLILHDPIQIAQNPLVKFHLLTNIAFAMYDYS